MRTHKQIVSAAGADLIAQQRGVSVHTVRSWITRDSIPSEHWLGLVERSHTTLEELAFGAIGKSKARKPNLPAHAQAAA